MKQGLDVAQLSSNFLKPPPFANNAQNIKPFTFHASGLFFKVEFLLDTQPFIFLENNLTTDGASV